MPPVASITFDHLERAFTYREPGLVRKHPKLIGFHPDNRGGMGISSKHAHEVAYSCLDGVIPVRYKQVDVVRVPEEHLKPWRSINEKKCRNDLLMPNFSPDMRFAALSSTHFTHAVKLEQDGGRSLFNKGAVSIVFKKDGSEAKKIQEDGLLCCVYSEELWKDKEALRALMQADNNDADVQMREDEMQLQGRIDAKVREMSPCSDRFKIADAMAGLTGTFSREHLLIYIDFRLSISDGAGVFFFFIFKGIRPLPPAPK